MTELDGVKVRMNAYIDEAWLYTPELMLKDPAVKRDALGRVISIPRFPSGSHWFKRDDRGAESRPGVVTLTPDMMPSHSHSYAIAKQIDDLTSSLYRALDIPKSFAPHQHSISVAATHGHQIHHNHRFDPVTIFKSQKLERDDVMDVGLNVETWLKDEMRKQLIEFEKEAMHTILYGDGSPIDIKENNMTDRTLRKPESTTVETSDLVTAIRALGAHDLEYLLDAVALVQDLKPGERLTKAKKLKPQDVGVHLQIIDGPAGVLTDIRDYDEFSRQNNGFVKTVLGGKMVDIRGEDFVVVTALAN